MHKLRAVEVEQLEENCRCIWMYKVYEFRRGRSGQNFFQNCRLIILQAPNTRLMRFEEKSFQREVQTRFKYFNKLERMINAN